MVPRLITALTSALRRMGSDRILAAAAFATLLLATTLIAVGPIYADAVAVAGLRRTLESAPPTDANLEASIRLFPDYVDLVDPPTRRVIAETLAPIDSTVFRHLEGGAFEIDGLSSEATPLASIESFEDIAEHAELIAGAWPDHGERNQAAVEEATALDLGLSPGETISLTYRRDPEVKAELEVVGVFRAHQADDAYWFGDQLIARGSVDSGGFRTYGPFVVASEAMLERLSPDRLTVAWRGIGDFDAITVDGAEALRSLLTNLESELTAASFSTVDQAASGGDAGFHITTALPPMLNSINRSLTITRSSVLTLLIQLGVLAGYSLVLTGRLLADTRIGETALTRSRGASPIQVSAISAIEGLMLAVPAVALAPLLASVGLVLLNVAGPLAAIDLTIVPRPTLEAWMFASAASLVALLALVGPTYRSASRFGASSQRHARERTASAAQRLGIDIALLAIACLVFWQLTGLDDQVVARVRGRFGVDPLLVLAPALGLLAGAVLALRIVPLLARMAEKAVVRTRRAEPALVAWQVARRPTRYGRSSLLLILAVGIGFFAASYTATWTQSQIDQAEHLVGADIRMQPNRAVGGSVSDLHLTSAIHSLPGVEEAMPVVRATGAMIGTNGTSEFLILDAKKGADVITARGDQVGDLSQLMQSLVEARPALATVPVPGTPESIQIDLEVIEVIPDDNPGCRLLSPDDPVPEPEVCFDGRLNVVVVDGNGLLHRLDAGVTPVNEGQSTITIPLLDPGRTEAPLAPTYPIGIMSIEIVSYFPETPRVVTLTISDIAGVSGQGTQTLRMSDDWAGWSLESSQVIGSSSRPSVSEGELPLELEIETGSGFGIPPVYFTLRPTGTTSTDVYPVLVTEPFLESGTAGIGEELRLTPLRLSGPTSKISGTVRGFPTKNPRLDDLFIIDLPTYLANAYEPGRPIPVVDEYWIAAKGDADSIADSLRESPFSSVSVETIADTSGRLSGDPVALGAIGSLAVGFVAAVVFASIGFALSAAVSARERIVEFGLLRAVGLGSGQLIRWLMMEQGVLVVVSLSMGTLLGYTMTAVLLPLISLTQDGAPVTPPVDVQIPWATILAMEVAIVISLAAMVAVTTTSLRRMGLGSLLRAGEER